MKNLLLLAVSILLFTSAKAQFEFKPGVKAGLNIASLTDASENDNALYTFHIATSFGLKFAKFYTLQPEVGYSRQGTDFDFRSSNGQQQNGNRGTLNIDYLTLSIFNKFYLKKGFNLQVAPFFDILLKENGNEYVESVDTGIIGGIGYDFPLGLTLDLRFKQGIVPVIDDYYNYYDNTNYYYYDGYRANQVLQLSVGYRF